MSVRSGLAKWRSSVSSDLNRMLKSGRKKQKFIGLTGVTWECHKATYRQIQPKYEGHNFSREICNQAREKQ